VRTADEILETDVYLEKSRSSASIKENVVEHLNITPESKRIWSDIGVLLLGRECV
jgi:hypothetical protein